MVQEEGTLPGQGTSETTEALGMTSGEIVIDLEEGFPKKGRGRPAGSMGKSSEEVSALRQEIQILKNKIEAFDTGNGSTRMSNAADLDGLRRSVERMDLRVSIIQQWVESFHMFLTTSRITNSADRMAEEELTKIISNLPDQSHPLFIGINAES
tara:strand:+ start:100 stop:561 length:462 start_codon:yes stop_codon:yes gene_type:complete